MSGPPPPVRNKSLDAKRASKAARHRAQLDLLDNKNVYPPITSGVSLLHEEPDMCVGEHVKLKGKRATLQLLIAYVRLTHPSS